ncbi:MAG: DUF4276 family protein, partial [Oxalobacteraceae bacterium]
MPSKSFVTALLAEGPTDRILLPILDWLLQEHTPAGIVFNAPQFIEPALLHGVSKQLSERIPRALEAQPCDLLFVHRDGDIEGDVTPRVAHSRRVHEIRTVWDENHQPPVVCVIPVQETEAWYLLDEAILRRVVGNPKGVAPLSLPRASGVEQKRDAKAILHVALVEAMTVKDRNRLEKREVLRCLYRLEYERMDYAV